MGRLTLGELEKRKKEEPEPISSDTNWYRLMSKGLANAFVISVTEYWVDSEERREWEKKRLSDGLSTDPESNPNLLDGSHEPIAYFVFGSQRVMDVFYTYITGESGMKYLRGLFPLSENYYRIFVSHWDCRGVRHPMNEYTRDFTQSGELIKCL